MRRFAISALATVVAAMLLVAGWAVGRSTAAPAIEQYSAVLNGGQQVPPVKTDALGVAHLVFNADTGRLCVDMTVTTLEGGAVTAAHVHPGAPNKNGLPVFGLGPSSPFNNDCGTLDATNTSLLRAGRLYLNVHNAGFPDGEIRGQILP